MWRFIPLEWHIWWLQSLQMRFSQSFKMCPSIYHLLRSKIKPPTLKVIKMISIAVCFQD